MAKEEKKRAFESETLILPALKMVLVENEKDSNCSSTKITNKKVRKAVNEETVKRIISKLSMKD